jgi:hypothetical protein
MSDSISSDLFDCVAVICHSCRIDFADSVDTGAVAYDAYCYCPSCYSKATADASRPHNYDALQFPYFRESFRDFVYRFRDS